MKKIAFYASIMVLCLGIVACNGKKNNEQEEQPAEQHECCCHHHEMSEEECAAMKAMMEQWANFDNLTEEAQVALLAQRKEMMDKMMKPCCKQGEEGCCKGEKTCCKGENAEGEHTCCKGENAEGEHACCKGEKTCCKGEKTCCKGEKTGERPELTEEQKAEMQAKMEAFKANWENWDNLTIAEKKALIDEADAMMCPHHHGPRPEEKPAE